MKLKYCLLIVFFVSQVLYAGPAVTEITTQEQFDEAVDRINGGEEMHLLLGAGRYVLRKNLVAKAPLSIKGEGAVISCARTFRAEKADKTTDTHYIFKLKKPMSVFPLFYDKDGNIIPVSEAVSSESGVNYVDGEIVASEEYEEGVSIQIPIPSNLAHLKNQEFQKAFGYLDSGWTTVYFNLEHSDAKFFYCKTITACSTKNYNYDKKSYKKPVRFVLYNAELKPETIYFDKEWLYIPKELGGVYCLNSNDEEHKTPRIIVKGDFELEKVSFIGFSGIEVSSKGENICEIKDCNFQNTLYCALKVNKKQGQDVKAVNIKNCDFRYCAVFQESMVGLTSSYEGVNSSI